MNADQLHQFMRMNGLYSQTMSQLLGVTRPCVDHWLSGRRQMPQTTGMLIKLFIKYPWLMNEFRLLCHPYPLEHKQSPSCSRPDSE